VSSRSWVAALVLLAAVGLACDGGKGPPAHVCVIHADNPHLSSSGLKKGRFDIIGKGWFKCTKSPAEITIYVELQQKKLGVWVTVVPNSKTFLNPPANKKSDEVIALLPGCPDGKFRTRAKGVGTDETGERGESEWDISAEATDPCKK
jgi:hypothetical protein